MRNDFPGHNVLGDMTWLLAFINKAFSSVLPKNQEGPSYQRSLHHISILRQVNPAH